MSNEESRKKVRVFVPQTFEGVTSVAILEEITHSNIDLDIRYTPYLDFRDYQLFADVEMIIALGLPYKGYNLPNGFYGHVDVPFVDFLHFSSYGEEIQGKHVVSLVNTEVDPVKELSKYLQSSPDATIISKHITFTEKAQYLIEAVNAYRTWTWENNDTARMLLALYNAGYKWLPHLVRGRSLPEIIKAYAPVIKGQIEKMNDFIEKKRQMTKTYTTAIDGETCLVKVVFAEDYINELANDLLHSEVTPHPVVVCVGRSTKGSDMFSIRTKNIDAARVAYLINEGNGKEAAATVFTDVRYVELMGNVIVTALSQEQ
jgi:hypothetical protein